MTDGIYLKSFSELTTDELYEIVRARCEIFVLECGMRCRDFDGRDKDAMHCFTVRSGKIAAYMRAFADCGTLTLGRVLTLCHGKGYGRELITEGLKLIRERAKFNTVTLHSQVHARGFYEKLGFVSEGEEFIEEGVLHVTMCKKA
jgi:ElaA protein